MDLKIGLDTPYPTNDVWSSMRLVRKEGEASAKTTSAAPAEAKAFASAGAALVVFADASPSFLTRRIEDQTSLVG